MTAADWPQIDSSAVEMSNEDSSSDLFGGDLFGDELLDMYHSSVVVGSGGSDVVDSIPSEIPSIPSHPGNVEGIPEGTGSNDTNNSAQPPVCSSNVQDGFGSFRPSTSFNDFTSILSPHESPAKPTPHSNQNTLQSQTIPDPPLSTDSSPKGKKRSLPATVDENPPQKRATGNTPVVQNQSQVEQSPEVVPGSPQTNSNVAYQTKHQTESQKSHNAQDDPNKDTPDPLISMPPRPGLVPATATPNSVPSSAVALSPPSATLSSVGVAHTPANHATNTTVKAHSHAPPQMVAINHPAPVANTVPSSDSVVKTEKTVTNEETFKGVAQVAVSNLILSAGGVTPKFDSGRVTDDDSDSSFHTKPVDTSTAHVAALTSNNWVAACAASVSGAPPGTMAAAQAAALAAASDPAAAKAARARRATLTADERARQNRDRNREHARNTRLRKKAYVEELKRTLTELVAQRDASDLEKRHEKQRDLEVREVRYRVMEEFLKLRARGSESNLLARWVAILEDGFTLTLPKTEYRHMVQSNNGSSPTSTSTIARSVSLDCSSSAASTNPNRSLSNDSLFLQVLKGATESMEDAAKVAAFVNTLGHGNQPSNPNAVRMTYHCDRKHFMMDGVTAVLDWTLSTNGAVLQGARSELIVKGAMRATFSPASNKLICAEMTFDTGSVVSQIKSLVNNTEYSTISADTDALLDSLQMPKVGTLQSTQVPVPSLSSVSIMPSTVSIASSDKHEPVSSDEEGNVQHVTAAS